MRPLLESSATAETKELYSVKQICSRLSVGKSTVYKWCREGLLSPIKFGRRCTRFRSSEVQELVNHRCGREVV